MTSSLVSHSNKLLVALAAMVGCVLLVTAGSAVAANSPSGKLLPKTLGDLRVQQALTAAREHPRPKSQVRPRPATQPAPVRQAGTIEMRQGPFPATDFAVSNMWQGPVGSSWLVVYAGAKRQDGTNVDQPAVRVYRQGADTHLTLVGTFPAAGVTGRARIAGMKGNLIELQTDTGRRTSFNLMTHDFQ